MTTTPTPDAISLAFDAERFSIGGRVYSRRSGGPGCASFYGPESARGERAVLPVWTADGKPSMVTVRPSSPVVVL